VESFGLVVFQPTRDFAILRVGEALLPIHADHTCDTIPLLSLAPESGPGGGGTELDFMIATPIPPHRLSHLRAVAFCKHRTTSRMGCARPSFWTALAKARVCPFEHAMSFFILAFDKPEGGA